MLRMRIYSSTRPLLALRMIDYGVSRHSCGSGQTARTGRVLPEAIAASWDIPAFRQRGVDVHKRRKPTFDNPDALMIAEYRSAIIR